MSTDSAAADRLYKEAMHIAAFGVLPDAPAQRGDAVTVTARTAANVG